MIKTLILAFLILIANKSFSCSCESDSQLYGFYDVVSKNRTNIIAVVDSLSKISDIGFNEIGYFTIIDTINSSAYRIGDTLSLTGQDGINCGEILSQFQTGDTLILTLNNHNFLDICTKNYLKISNALNNKLSIPSIKDKIKKIITAFNQPEDYGEVSIYPNPAKDWVNLQSGEFKLNNLKIIDPSGRQYFLSSEAVNNNVPINISHLPSGLYMVLLESDHQVFTRLLSVL